MSIFDRFKKPQPQTPEQPINGFDTLKAVIGEEQIKEAYKTLQEYKTGKSNLENRIIENDKWYKLRHWECVPGDENQVKPVSAWLFNSIANKHADAMDNFPAPNILPREEGDKADAEMLSSIIPVVLDQADFEQTYSDLWQDKLKSGTGIYGVFWDPKKLNGLGDISIKNIDLLNIFWEPGVKDIQASKNIFHVDLVDKTTLALQYPNVANRINGKNIDVSKYAYDDTVNTESKVAVIDWYYKRNVGGKTILHYAKFVNDVLLYASENDGNYATRGFYDHGLYPFVFDTLYTVPGSPAGFGFVEIGKSAQEYIDRGKQAIMKNLLANASPRYFIREGGQVNEKEFADLSNDFIHVKSGTLGDDSIRPVQFNTLSGNFLEVISRNIEELKETTGNRDVSNGGTTSGVTAAAGIAAMQEAGSKLSRDIIKSSYRQYRKVILLVVELIRQFYDAPRSFRIIGENGARKYVEYTNAKIKPYSQGTDFGIDMGMKMPLFDIEITAEKSSPYSRMAQNELMIQLYGLGVFNPQMADQALMLLNAMDFDRKEFITQRVAQNGTMLQQLMALAQIVDTMKPPKKGQPSISQSIAMQYGMPIAQSADNAELETGPEEPATTKKARERVAESTSPQ